jgi:hypothetical protein
MRAADVPDVARIATAIESRRAFEHQNRRPVTPRRNCSAQRGIAAADDRTSYCFVRSTISASAPPVLKRAFFF